jgi:hypothetical protein
MRCPVHASRRKHHSATRSLARCLLARPPYPIPPCTESVPTPLSNHNMVRRMVGSRLHASTRVYPAPGGADSNCLDPDLAAPTQAMDDRMLERRPEKQRLDTSWQHLSAHTLAASYLDLSSAASAKDSSEEGDEYVPRPISFVRANVLPNRTHAHFYWFYSPPRPKSLPAARLKNRHGPRPVFPLTSLTSHTQANHPVRGGQQLKLLGGPGANLKTVHLEPFSIRLGLFWRLDVLVQQPAHLRGRPALQFYGVLQPLQRLPQPPRWQGRGGRDARAVAGLGRCLHHQPLFKSQPHIIRWWRPTV